MKSILAKNNTKLLEVYKLLKIIFSFEKRYLIGMSLCTILLGIIPFVSLLNTQEILNFIQNRDIRANKSIIPYLVFFIIIAIFNEFLEVFNSLCTNLYEKYLAYEFNLLILKKTKELTLKDFENPLVYDMLQRAEAEGGVRPFKIIVSFVTSIKIIIKLVISVIILINWNLLAVALIVFLPIISSFYFYKINKEEYLVNYNRTKHERLTWYIAHLLTKDTYIKEIKILNLFNYLYNRFKKTRFKFITEDYNLSKKRSAFNFIFQSLCTILTTGMSVIAMLQALSGLILVGTMTTIINTLNNFENTIRTLIGINFSLYQDILFISNLNNFLEYNSLSYTTQILNKKRYIDSIEYIEFKNVSYKYANSSKMALDNISFIFKKNDIIALVGQNGSGKSTLVKILLKLYEDYKGEILVNGIDFKDIDSIQWLNLVSTVLQDYNKYQFNVLSNIGFGDLNKIDDIKKIKNASAESDSLDFILKLDNKFNQQLGSWFEGGVQLSGGQWQKLSLARLYIREAKLYILDEPTAALDPISEYKIFNKFIKNTNDKISIFITHRFNNAKIANKILVLENGKLIEEGCHEQLIKNNGLYAKLYNIQNSTFDLNNEQLNSI